MRQVTRLQREKILIERRNNYLNDKVDEVDDATKHEMDLVDKTATSITNEVLDKLKIPRETFDATHKQLAKIPELIEILNKAHEGKLYKTEDEQPELTVD